MKAKPFVRLLSGRVVSLWLAATMATACDWSNESYSLLDRPDLDDRFFIYDQRASLGLPATIMQHWTASVSAGYVFDRFMFQGDTFSAGSSERVELGNGPFAVLNLGVRS